MHTCVQGRGVHTLTRAPSQLALLHFVVAPAAGPCLQLCLVLLVLCPCDPMFLCLSLRPHGSVSLWLCLFVFPDSMSVPIAL